MTTIIKAGGSSVATAARLTGGYENGAKLPGIYPQIQGMDDRIIFITSAQGKTTNNIKDFIAAARGSDKLTGFDDIFSNSKHLNLIYSPASRGRRYSMETDIQKLRENPSARKELNDPSYEAKLHMMGERIAAIDAWELAVQSGIHAELVDIFDEPFPLSVRGDYMNAGIDFEDSSARTEYLLKNAKAPLIIIPGYGGMNRHTKTPGILARGGSDRAAIAMQYAAHADELWILTDIDGIKTANVPGAETVPVLGIYDAKAAATLGVKLPGAKSLEGLEMRYRMGEEPGVYIAHAQQMNGNRTSIVKNAPNTGTIILVGGRPVDVYTFTGNVKKIEDTMRGRNVEFAGIRVNPDEACMAVPNENRDHTNSVVRDFLDKKRRAGTPIDMEYEEGKGYIGVVGGVRRRTGMLARFSGLLANEEINVEDCADPSRNSIGFIIDGKDVSPGIEALYRRLILQQS